MYQLLYFSRSSRPMTDADLDKILSASRKNNERADVSGLLLFSQDTFFQVLEGKREDVQRTFDRVSEDPRHRGVWTLVKRDREEREFGQWSMGFCRAEDPQDLPEAFFDLSHTALRAAISSNASDELVQHLQNFASAKMPA